MDIKELGEMLRAWKLEGATLQWRESDSYEWEKIGDQWITTRIIDTIYNDFQMRVKPKTTTLPARGIPVPETVAPIHGTKYYVPVFSQEYFYSHAWWSNDIVDKRLLERGLVYLKKEDAALAAKAMLQQFRYEK